MLLVLAFFLLCFWLLVLAMWWVGALEVTFVDEPAPFDQITGCLGIDGDAGTLGVLGPEGVDYREYLRDIGYFEWIGVPQ